MENLREFHDKTITQWMTSHPLLVDLQKLKPVFWINHQVKDTTTCLDEMSINKELLQESSFRLERFAPFLKQAFEELGKHGIIESDLLEVPLLKEELSSHFNTQLCGKLFLKCDHQLPVSGSIKARGGFYEILKLSETIALKHQLISKKDNYSKLLHKQSKEIFAQYSIVVGSTGNLGLSIGIMSKKFGFKVTVHMSNDAKKWKKDKLRALGVVVIEHSGDYEQAVKQGRKMAQNDHFSHFVDDENSIDLFMGYAVAALRLEKQLKKQNILLDDKHPLFVYLPCGVGGAPGGITWGLKTVFKNNVHCFFAEPTHSPSMLLGLYTELHEKVSVYDIGIDNKTQADGLAVGRPSGFVGETLQYLINGCYSIADESLFELLHLTHKTTQLCIEPSAAAGIMGIKNICENHFYLNQNNLQDVINNITHIAWTTGGSMVPKEEMNTFIQTGEKLLSNTQSNT